MDKLIEIRTVLGRKKISKDTVTLSHEHICCYSETLNMMSKHYLNKVELVEKSVAILTALKEKHNLGLLLDCTPLNIGRDVEVLKSISEISGVDIVCSTGFYYQEDPILNCMSAETLSDFVVEDANNTCCGMIKAAVESGEMNSSNIKMLKAAAIAQRKTELPVVLHTNAKNKNGIKAVEILLEENVPARRIVVGHLSDTDDLEYMQMFANMGCFVALDRMYGDTSDNYIRSKAKHIAALSELGYRNQILISHDDAVFQGFCENPEIRKPRWGYIFHYIAPVLEPKLRRKVLIDNPLSMLCGK